MSSAVSREKQSELVRCALGIARMLAMIKGQLHRLDDVTEAALCGLADALRTFDASRHVDVEAFARIRITGEVLDAIRANVQRAAREVAFEDLEDGEGGAPEEEAVTSHALCCAAEELHAGGEAGLLRKEAYGAMHEEIARLPAEGRRLLDLRYWEMRPMEEVVAALALPERTVRERHRKLRRDLKAALLARPEIGASQRRGRVVPLSRPPRSGV